MKASVIDYARVGLDNTIWDTSGPELKLWPNISLQIIDIAASALDDFDIPESVVKGIYVYGSIMTNQYNAKTDVDCRILLSRSKMTAIYPDLTGDEIFSYLEDVLHGQKAGDTEHPLNYSVIIEGEQEDLGRTKFDPVYDVINDKVIREPIFVAEDFDPDEEFTTERDQIEVVMENLDKLLRDTKTKTIDFAVLKEAIGHVKDPEKLKQRLQNKLKEIEIDIERLVAEYESIKEERSKALTQESETSPHRLPGNVKHKYLERYQYLDVLKKLKHILKDGVTPKEIPDVAEALHVTNSKDVYIKKLEVDDAPEDLEIWLVDGGIVRNKHYIDFTLGGHDLVYDFIPSKQIWIDNDTAEDERAYVIKHELCERKAMSQGKSYDEAHEEASKVEQVYRDKAAYTRKEDVPVPPEKIYHASPYAKEILEQGFIINPERQTLGGHGTYVSTTNLDEALEYARDLKLVIGFLNDEFGWEDLEAQLNTIGINSGLGMAIADYATNELFRTDNYKEILPEELKDKHPYSEEMQEFFKAAYFNGADFTGNPIGPEQEIKRRWEALHSGHIYFKGDRDFVLLFGSDPPEHLLGRSSNDVGVVELVHAPVATDTPTGYQSYLEEEEKKGKYTYNESENEWRFYDTSDLWPVRIIEAAKIPK